MPEELDASEDIKVFWKHLKFKDIILLALIVSNILMWYKINNTIPINTGNGTYNFLIK